MVTITPAPPRIQLAFYMFLLNGGYRLKVKKGIVKFTHATRPSLEVKNENLVNDEFYQRWQTFLKCWLRDGRQFIDQLVLQYERIFGPQIKLQQLVRFAA